MALSADGTKLYISDKNVHRVRVMDTTTNDVTLLAGLYGTLGTADGTGGGARFNNPAGLALDGTLLYVGDKQNHAIRSVDVTTGVVTTVAGAIGTAGHLDATGASAQFDIVSDVFLSDSTLYIADYNNHVIRSADTGTWAVTTLAGIVGSPGTADGAAASAKFNNPVGLAGLGTVLFVADYNNHFIRSIDTFSLTVSTLAGSGAAGAADGNGPAAQFDLPTYMVIAAGTMYVSDYSNHAIRAVGPGTGEVTTFAGALGSPGAADGTHGDARFNQPMGLAVFGGTMYVADYSNHVIRSVEVPAGEPHPSQS